MSNIFLDNIDVIKGNLDVIKGNLGYFMDIISNNIIRTSNFNNIDYFISDLNDPTILYKNNTFTEFTRSLETVYFFDVPISIYLLSYKNYLFLLKNKKEDNFDIKDIHKIYLRDYFFLCLENDYNSESVKKIKFYISLYYISYLLNFNSTNIYLLIPQYLHSDYFIDLTYYLLTEKILIKFKNNNTGLRVKDLGFMFHTYYANYIYGDIIEYKFKKFDNGGYFTNIEVYKIFHTVYKQQPDSYAKFKNLFSEHISKVVKEPEVYTNDGYINKMHELYLNPYGTRIIFESEIITDKYESSQDNFDTFLSLHTEKNSLENDFYNEINSFTYNEHLQLISKTFGIEKSDHIFYILYYIFFTNNVLLKELWNNYTLIIPELEKFLGNTIKEPRRYLIGLNNLNMIDSNTRTDVVELEKFALEFNYPLFHTV